MSGDGQATRPFLRFLIILIALGLVAVTAFQINKRSIAEWVFAKALEERIADGQNIKRADGIHVFICGAGAPMPSSSAGPCTAVIAGDKAFVFDVGSGSPRRLGLTTFPIDQLDGVFLTHFHSDHIDSLGELLLLAWINGQRDRPMPIYGPEGVQVTVKGFNAAYRLDRGYRTAHHGPEIANPLGFGGAPKKIEPGIVFDEDGVRVSAISVSHDPVEPALGYRIDYKDRSVTISGDTVFSEGFAEFSKGADLIIHEGLQPHMIKMMGATLQEHGDEHLAKIMDDILDYHTSPEGAARIAQIAGADVLVINHIVPPTPVKLLHSMFLGGARKNFDGKIYLANDGMTFSLPAGSKRINKNQEI